MGIKISQLPSLTLGNIRDANQLPVVDTTTLGTKKVTIGDIKSYATQGLSTIAFSGSYNDLTNVPSVFPIPTASPTQLGGIRVGTHLSIDNNGILDALPSFDIINVGNDQISAATSRSLNVIPGSNITFDTDTVTNTITINSSGGGGGGSGNVGKATTGTLAVYFNTNTVTGTNLVLEGDSITIPGVVTAAGFVADTYTATRIVTTIGDLIIAPNANVSVTGKRIINLSAPVGSNDAATKAYVDAQTSRAFGKVAVPGQGLVSATSGTDTLNFAAGNNVTLSTNPASKTVTISVNNTLSFALLPATTSSIGGVIIGSGLTIDNNGVVAATAQALTTATTSTLGGIIIGDGLSIDGNGRVSSAAQFTLNTATSSVVGGVKIGFGLNIDSQGTISVPTQVLTTATKFILGGVKIGNSIAAAVDGTIDVDATKIAAATTSTLGVVKPGYGLSVDNTGALNLGVNGNFTITGNLAVAGVISATNIFTTGTAVTIISSANDLQLRAVGQVITNTTLFVNTGTPATSTSTGALQVWGGIGVGKNIITGEPSTIDGIYISGSRATGGVYNIAVGSGALGANNGASYLTAVGFNALQLVNSSENSAFGYNAGNSITSGSKNTMVGQAAGSGMASGTYNSAFGHQSYVGQGGSSYNTIIGSNINTIANQVQTNNTFIGYNIANSINRPGSYNIAIGGNNLQATTGTSNIVIGYGAGSGLTTASNQVIIGGYNGSAIATQTGYISLADGVGTLRAQWDNKGQVTFFNTATFYSTQNASNSTNTGAVQIAGGAGIALDLYVGGTVYSQGSPVVTQAYLGTPISSVIAGTDTAVVVNGSAVTVWSTATLQSISVRGNTTNNSIFITNPASSTGTTTGALVVTGSIATAQDIYVGSRVMAGADSTASSTATTVGLFDRGRRVMTQAILIGDLGIEVTTSSNTATVTAYNIKNIGVRSIEVGNDVALLSNGTSALTGTGTVTINVTSNLDTVTRRGADANVPVRILNTNTVSTGTSSGGLVVVGGLGLTGALNIQGSITLNGAALSTASVFNGGTITGALWVNNATASTSTSIGTNGNGSISTPGGISVGKDVNVGGNIYINGLQLSTSTIFNGGAITNALIVNNATASTSTNTGALQVGNGGVGIGGRVVATSYYITTATGTTPVPLGYGPIFSAYLSGTQNIASGAAPTKVTFQTKEYDTGSYYDNVSNFRYTPLVQGYYDVYASIQQGGVSATGFAAIELRKNGTSFKAGNRNSNNANTPVVQLNALVPMNGSTDYIEIWYAQTTGAAMTLAASSTATFFQATFVRGL